MTSLIDVIFLLLLFFMLSSTFTKFEEIKLSAASAGQQAGPVDGQPLFMRLSEERTELNGRVVELDGLLAALDQVAGEASDRLLIAPDETATSQRLVDVLVVLSARPDLSVLVLE